MNLWWNHIDAVSAFNTWTEVIFLAAATLTFISLLLLWRSGNRLANHLIDRERRANRRIRAVEKAAEEIRKELLSAQQSQDIVDQQRRLAQMDAEALRNEMEDVRQRYANAEGDLKKRIEALKDIHTTHGITQGSTQGAATTQGFAIDSSRLDSQQQKMLIKLLKTGPKGELDLISVLENPGSQKAALELKNIFDENGWSVSDIVQSAFSKPPEGIVLVIHSKATAPSYAKFLQRTLTTVGLPVSAQVNTKYREWSISMIVGQIESA